MPNRTCVCDFGFEDRECSTRTACPVTPTPALSPTLILTLTPTLTLTLDLAPNPNPRDVSDETSRLLPQLYHLGTRRHYNSW